jgi:uncharacterized protein YfbU (UPF0304 family)
VVICRIVFVALNNAKNGITFLTPFFSSYRKMLGLWCLKLTAQQITCRSVNDIINLVVNMGEELEIPST